MKRPETYEDFRRIYHAELRDAGRCLTYAYHWLFEYRTPGRITRCQWVRRIWTHTHRIRRIERRLWDTAAETEGVVVMRGDER